jgi:hypothetical protein
MTLTLDKLASIKAGLPMKNRSTRDLSGPHLGGLPVPGGLTSPEKVD